MGATRENLGYLLAKASQRWNELLYAGFKARGFADVRPAHGSVLLPLFEEDGLRMGELASRSRLSKQTMTTLVRVVERNGLVRRERDPEDGRAFRIWLTPRSRRFQPVADQVLVELDALVAARVPGADLETARFVLKGVLELWTREPSPQSSTPQERGSSTTSQTSGTSRNGQPSSRVS